MSYGYKTHETVGYDEDDNDIDIVVYYEYEAEGGGYAVSIYYARHEDEPYAYSEWEADKWIDEIIERLQADPRDEPDYYFEEE